MCQGVDSLSQVIVLVGPKGAGKTTLGRVLEREPGVHFLEVESIAKRVLADMGGVIDERYAREAFAAIVVAVDSMAGSYPTIVLETTGASTETPAFIDALRRLRSVRLVRIVAPAETCATRIAQRDSSRQVDVPPDLIRAMHERTEALRLPWDLELTNDPPLTDEQVRAAFRHILSP